MVSTNQAEVAKVVEAATAAGVKGIDTAVQLICTSKGCCLADEHGKTLAAGRVFSPEFLENAGLPAASLTLSDPDEHEVESNVVMHYTDPASPYDNDVKRWAPAT